MIEVIEEIVLALTICEKNTNCCKCPYETQCCNVFGKEHISEEVRELSAQCKAFNQFARANRED